MTDSWGERHQTHRTHCCIARIHPVAHNAQLRGGILLVYDFTSTIALATFLVVLALLQIMWRPLFATLMTVHCCYTNHCFYQLFKTSID